MRNKRHLAAMFARIAIAKFIAASITIAKGLSWMLVACLSFFVASCSQKPATKKFIIGFSQCQGGDDWRRTMLAEMKRELSFHDNVEFIYRDAEADSKKQARQVEELAQMKVDLLIVSPNEIQPLSASIEKVYDAGIPVVLVDRGINSEKYTAFIGASNFEVGQNAGRYAASLLKGKGTVLEVMGLSNASPFIDRHKGFMDIISRQPGIRYVKLLEDHAPTYQADLLKTLQTEKELDLIFAQTDYIAIDVHKICKKAGVDNKVKIIGVDGLPIDSLGMGMVKDKKLTATILYPTGGHEAILTAFNILEGKPFSKSNQLATSIIDSSNVRIMQLQNDKVVAQQLDIDKRQQKIEQQLSITQNQTQIILMISVTLAVALILGVILFYYLTENRKINARLTTQNAEILEQRNQLIELGKQAEAATDAKVNFFTNISHELRTPLTLIMGPLDEVRSSPKLHFSLKPSLDMVQQNSRRLLRLVNQLMDFRKIEEAKMKLRAGEHDLAAFVTEIGNAFSDLAQTRKITYRVDIKATPLMAWFDVNMMDKILFNLLSNAFKYTSEQGAIEVSLQVDEAKQNAVITVADSGIGMSPEAMQHAFDVFYQGNDGSYPGTGIGLALSKELIGFHHGTISVKSKKGEGAVFQVTLPLGNAHLEPDEILAAPADFSLNEEEATLYIDEATTTEPLGVVDQASPSSAPLVLVIEDNADVRAFISNQLTKHYEVVTAENGNAGLHLAFEMIPDLVISDIMLPGKDGLVITETLKNDIRTSHIPIIILTAKGSMEQQIEGLKTNADAYIVKPFNIQYLEQHIKNLLRNRETLKAHYSSELPQESQRNASSKKLDRKFISEFSSIIEQNIANENFSVNDLCTEMGISRVQLYRKVKAVLGYNINEYILEARMQKAKYLLVNEQLSIAEVAYQVGFASQAYFSTVFKSKFGVTPKGFREQKGG